MLAGNGPDALACRAGGSDRSDLGCVIRDGCGSTKSRPFGLCPCQPSHDTFPDHGAFKLGKHAKHLKHRAAGRRGGVEPLLMQIQVDALGVEFLQDADQVDQRSAEPIDAPGCDQIELFAGDGLQQLVEPGR